MHVNLLFKKIAALIPCLLLTVALNAQTVTKAFRSVPLKTVLEEVERQTGYSILFENEDVDVSRPVTATFKDATLQTVLDTVLDKSLRYTVMFYTTYMFMITPAKINAKRKIWCKSI